MNKLKNINADSVQTSVIDKSISTPAVSVIPENQKLSLVNSTQSRSNNDIGSSWSTTLSQYFIQRRKQTQLAYQNQLVSPHIDVDESSKDIDEQDMLFKAVFEVLVQRLDEGHTVVVLESSDRQDDGVEPMTWQQKLLHPLLQSLSVILAETSTTFTDSAVIELLEREDVWQASMRQSVLSQYDKHIVEQRRATVMTLYKWIQQIKDASGSTKNSLSIFCEMLSRNELFANQVNGKENDTNKPIVFQIEDNLDSQGTRVTLWLHRTWQAEHALATHIKRIKDQSVEALPIASNPMLNVEQQNAIHMANKSAFSIITGGPGTGKTFTVAQLVIALQQDRGAKNNISKANLALAAPTGKAAQRMQESLQNAIQHAGVSIQLPEAKTIHRLLGIGQGGRPRYHTDNQLSEDIVIVDEASMLGVELANYLVSAIKPNARLILLGDANQLAAVDAGAVLADLCRIPVLQDVHQRLKASQRFTEESGISKLAKMINQTGEYQNAAQNMNAVWQLLEEDETLTFYNLTMDTHNEGNDKDNVSPNRIINSLSKSKFLKKIGSEYAEYIKESYRTLSEVRKSKFMPVTSYVENFNILMKALNQFRVLTAGHHGNCGDHYINRYLSEHHKTQLKLPLSKSTWYHGRPVMVLQNNYELGLFNGDIGICLQTERGRLQVFFENKTQGIVIDALSDEMIATAYAMTIHKSQGSEFEHVAISFDDQNGRLLSQELIYTAVTRAKKQVSIFSTASAFTHALTTPTVRQTGLKRQFSQFE